MNKQSLPYTIIFTFIVTFVFVLVLSFTNSATVELVERNQELFRQTAVLDSFGIVYDDNDQAIELFSAIEQVERGGVELFRTTVGGETVYSKRFEGPGLWGTIIGYIAVDERVERVIGLQILEDNETPGLGGRINDDDWKAQFAGESILNGIISVAGVGAPDFTLGDGEVNAITGATRTTESMQAIISSEIAILQGALGGGA